VQQGILGIVILILMGVAVWQQRRIDKKDIQITDLQDKRITDSNQYTSNYISIARESVETSKDNLSALSLLQRSVDTLATSLQKLLDNK
jgi:hypothetical protein